MLTKTVRVAENQRVLWFRDGNLMGVLAPGKYNFWKRTRHLRFDSFNVEDGEAILPNAQYLVREHGDVLKQYLDIRVLGQDQVALISVNKLVTRLALPGEVVAFWKNAVDTAIQVVGFTDDLAVPDSWIKAINRSGDALVRRETRSRVKIS